MIYGDKVTIGIPVYNGDRYITKTIFSILNQSYKNIEILVSDNASTDNTLNLLEEITKSEKRVRLLTSKINVDFSNNVNKIVSGSSTEFVSIFHADDIYENTIIEEEVLFLIDHPKCAGVFTLGKMINDEDKIIKNRFIMTEKNTKSNIIFDHEMFIKSLVQCGSSLFICPTFMVRKIDYKSVGGLDNRLKIIDDQDLWLRLLEKYKLGIISKELIRYRIHFRQGSEFYRNKNRQELSLPIKHIIDYLKKQYLYTRYLEGINLLIAKDYIKIAYYQSQNKNYEISNTFLKKSNKLSNIGPNNKYFYITLILKLKNSIIILFNSI